MKGFKKTIILILTILLSFVVVSCGLETTEETTSEINNTNSSADQEILEAAANRVIISNQDRLLESFDLPAEVNGLTITWESDNEEVISIASAATATGSALLYAATVIRPNQVEGTATVTLTATFYYGDATYVKDYVVRVPVEEDATVVDTIAAGLELSLGTYITWKDMTVIGFSVDPDFGAAGFFFTDGVDIMYVFNSTYIEDITIGSVYDIKGAVELFYDIPEIKNIAENVVEVTPSTGATATITPTLASIPEIINNHTGYDGDNPMEITYYRTTGTVYYNSSLGDYSTFLIPAGTSVLDKTNAIRIYYKGNMDAVSTFAGQEVTLDIVLFGRNASSSDWYAYFFGVASDITAANLTDADKLGISESQLASSYDIKSSFELPMLIYGDYTSVVVSSEISSYLSYAAGDFTVTRPDVDTVGTLDVTLEYNDESVTLTIDITMKAVVVVVPGDDIFISQYVEGGSYNKYIEIYNATETTVNLSEFTLELWSNGSDKIASAASATMTLTGTLAPGEVIVIGHSSGTIYTPDIINSSVMNFNGNDILILKHTGDIIDSIGQIGNGDIYGADMTLVRNASVIGGDTNPDDEYNLDEWDSYAKDSAFDLGSHTQE